MAGKATAIGPEVTNGGAIAVGTQRPYIVEAEIVGTADILFHRWNCEAVEEKAKAAKGSKEKKSDNVESYVYRDDSMHLCVPGEYVRQAVIAAAKYRQDPRSPRKSAVDLTKAGVLNLTPLASLGVTDWDYEDRRRVQVQRNAVTRVRPALHAGWKITVQMQVQLPEYIAPAMLHSLLNEAGRLIGIGDFRPTYGRFNVSKFEVVELD